MRVRDILVYGGLILLALSCGEKKKSTTDETDIIEAVGEKSIADANNAVKVIQCKRQPFAKRLLLTGVLKADQKASITFEVTGVIKHMKLNNGDFIRQGEVIAALDHTEEDYARAQALLRLDEVQMKKNERLILDGGEEGEDGSVSPRKLKQINTISGYDKAIQDLKDIDFRISRKTIKAPFSGTVANLMVKPYEMVSAGQNLCTLINPASFEASFMLLEGQAISLRKGQNVIIHPIGMSDKTIAATIHQINPIVNDQGLVEVRAKIGKNSQRLFENMNIRVIIEEVIQSAILIPKTALVRREDRDVVFTYDKESSRAKWHYVKVLEENDTHYAITEGINEGDMVIYQGNLNLNHDAQVEISIQEK